jgi:hypothetical protein
MRPNDAAAGSQRGSAGARLEGDQSTRIAPASSVKPEQRKGMGLGGYRARYRVGCVTVPAREGVRLTCGVREALGPAWQHPEEEDGAGSLHTLDWAGVIAVLG